MRPLAFSTCWNASRHEDGFAMLQQIRQLGFRSVQLDASLKDHHWPGVFQAQKKEIIDIVAIQSDLLKQSHVPFTVLHRQGEDFLDMAARLGQPEVIFSSGRSGQKDITRALERLYLRGKFLERPYTHKKVQAVLERRRLAPHLSARFTELLGPWREKAARLGLRLSLELGAHFEDFPHEEEATSFLAALNLSYWHDLGHGAGKEFLGWQTQAETLARFSPCLVGCHIHDYRAMSEYHLPLSHGDLELTPLIALLPHHTLPVLELSSHTPEEQVMASRHLWNSYVDASA